MEILRTPKFFDYTQCLLNLGADSLSEFGLVIWLMTDTLEPCFNFLQNVVAGVQ